MHCSALTAGAQCAVNVTSLVTLETVQRELALGPNGGLVYCMEYVAANLDWLTAQLEQLLADGTYLLFDCPGQVELFNVHDALQKVVAHLTDKLHVRCAAAAAAPPHSLLTRRAHRLTCVHLVDSHLCAEPAKYLAAVLLSLTTMLHLGLPHINVLSKLDLIESYGRLAFSLDFYTGEGDLSRLAEVISSQPLMGRYRKLTANLCELVQDYGLVSFSTLDVQNEASMRRLVLICDKCNGYIFSGLEEAALKRGDIAMPHMYKATQPDWDADGLLDVAEKYMQHEEDS